MIILEVLKKQQNKTQIKKKLLNCCFLSMWSFLSSEAN